MHISKEFRYIIVVIDTFTRYVKVFPAYDVTTDVLLSVRNAPRNRHRSGITIHEPDTPELRDPYRSATGGTIPYSKEENGIKERENKYPATKAGQGNPNKYGSWWRGPYLVTATT